VKIEISPLFAPDSRALKLKIDADAAFAKTIAADTYFQ